MNSDQFRAGLQAALRPLGDMLKKQPAEVATYADDKRAELARAVGQPGFEEAVSAAVDDIALFGAGRAVDMGDACDAEMIGVLHGALSVALGAR